MQRKPMLHPGSRWHDTTRVFRLLRSAADRRVLSIGLGTVLVVVMSAVLAALSPLVLKSLVDAVELPHQSSGTSSASTPWRFCAEYLLLLLAGRFLNDIRPVLSGTLNQRLHSQLTRRFFDHVTRLPMGGGFKSQVQQA